MAEAKKTQGKKYSRRDFVIGSGAAIAGGTLAAYTPSTTPDATAAAKSLYAPSTGYLVYDSRNCAGCQSCMLTCSLVNEGEASTSLSRIQITRSVLASYPNDVQIAACRQCPEPLCVANCPTGACHVDAANGNVRRIDAEKCIGCQTCLKSCPYSPHRTIWNPVAKKASKCDLCATAQYFSKEGGPSGKQACVETCPMGVLKVVAELPSQMDFDGYDVNLAPPSPPPGQSGAPKAKGEPSTPPAKK